MGTVVDISHRKAAEHAARIREAELAHLSRVATMGQMASGLAHELNQPLSAILNYLSVCLDQIESQKTSIPTAFTAIQEIMNEHAPCRRDHQPNAFVCTQAAAAVRAAGYQTELVRESVSMMEFELRHQRIRPHLALAPEPPKFSVTRCRSNRSGQSPVQRPGSDGARRLVSQWADGANYFARRRRQCAGPHCRITGSGILPENMDRLFQPFFTTKPKGLGMGLNISRSIIESLAGLLSSRSPIPPGECNFASRSPWPRVRRMTTSPIVHIIDDDAGVRKSLQLVMEAGVAGSEDI